MKKGKGKGKGLDLAIILGGPKVKGSMPKLKKESMEDEDLGMDMEDDDMDMEDDGVLEEIKADAAALFDGDQEKSDLLIDILMRLQSIEDLG